jgi:hypothetical protein
MLLAPIVTKHEVTDTFEVLTAVSVKIAAFWVATLCSAETA